MLYKVFWYCARFNYKVYSTEESIIKDYRPAGPKKWSEQLHVINAASFRKYKLPIN